ncbi:hypothetical protein L917_02525 [Phytophthora nicotianae]|uniref:Uncharacterized protein n=1 Tax=Phytophthora nicotianae TaxID=4792 RepID=W2FXF9_PHYNI|nr:hypothetical protein L915_17902 [Phytophthora nicotianae]ETK94308.1 hypothetical protein L915_02611 [Phytophthora nicotianae]ETL28914.1 hypothetical protein L916_17800 [Phytophthora nicotianae]ETL47680.1 hypothetical protein L916_02587 [Phytophthora nicotianae]ETL82155.1 hypothetical protein L917_17627 [Phytophthora nicotianae]
MSLWDTVARNCSTWTRCTAALRGVLVLWPRVTDLVSRRSWSWPWPPRRASPSPK